MKVQQVKENAKNAGEEALKKVKEEAESKATLDLTPDHPISSLKEAEGTQVVDMTQLPMA